MDAASRNARADEIGFMRDMPLQHGMAGELEGGAFDLSRGGFTSRSPAGKLGVWASVEDPDLAQEFAETAARRKSGQSNSQVLDLYHRAENPASLRLDGDETNLEMAATVSYFWDQGYDAIRMANYTSPGGKRGRTILVVKNPNQLRSPSAAFDPLGTDPS